MRHIDEEIVRARKAIARAEQKAHSDETVEKELEMSIFAGPIRLFEQEVIFAERKIPELNISIFMPESFFRLDDETKELIYPVADSPSHVFGGTDIQFSLAFDQTGYQVSNEQIKDFLPFIKKVIAYMGPKTRMLHSGVISNGEYQIGIMEFVSRAVDTNVYNVMFHFSINGGLMRGTINFPAEFQKRMIRIAKEMIDSLQILEEEEV